jgi:hypothetical protein
MATRQMPSQGEELLKQLPECSDLRAEVGHGSGIDQSYMALMRKNHVARAVFEVEAVLRTNKLEQIRVIHRLYFRQFDGPDSQISDEVSLKEIETDGLSAILEELAGKRILTAPVLHPVDSYWSSTKNLSTFVEFLASPWLREQPVVLSRSAKSSALTKAILHGDAVTTLNLVNHNKLSKDELNKELIYAVQSRYDNTSVINILLSAGADVNAKAAYGTTPLMLSVDHPCNIRPLLKARADLDAKNKWGRTALQIARQEKEIVAIRLLEEASSGNAYNKMESLRQAGAQE